MMLGPERSPPEEGRGVHRNQKSMPCHCLCICASLNPYFFHFENSPFLAILYFCRNCSMLIVDWIVSTSAHTSTDKISSRKRKVKIYQIQIDALVCADGWSRLSTAGLPISEIHTRNIFDIQEGLRQFQDHRWKALGEENSDPPGLFFCDHFLAFYF